MDFYRKTSTWRNKLDSSYLIQIANLSDTHNYPLEVKCTRLHHATQGERRISEFLPWSVHCGTQTLVSKRQLNLTVDPWCHLSVKCIMTVPHWSWARLSHCGEEGVKNRLISPFVLLVYVSVPCMIQVRGLEDRLRASQYPLHHVGPGNQVSGLHRKLGRRTVILGTYSDSLGYTLQRGWTLITSVSEITGVRQFQLEAARIRAYREAGSCTLYQVQSVILRVLGMDNDGDYKQRVCF